VAAYVKVMTGQKPSQWHWVHAGQRHLEIVGDFEWPPVDWSGAAPTAIRPTC